MRPLKVNSIAEEETALGHCECGARDRATISEELLPLDSRWYDSLVVRCRQCHRVTARVFDVTSFYEPRPGLRWGIGRG
jgi:hypothetical protein